VGVWVAWTIVSGAVREVSAMIQFLVDRKRRVVLVRYSALLTAENLDRLDIMSADFVAHEGDMDVIIDFRGVPAGIVETSVVVDRGRIPSHTIGGRHRVFIVKDDLHYGLMRIYAAYQDGQRQDVPDIARSLDEALALFDATGATFEPT
jgi:hypothetical protein